jgi:hypothetical protein
VTRTCLHCALARALRAESARFAARGLALVFTRSDPVWLPVSGARVYRSIRRLLDEAHARAGSGAVKLAVLDLSGKSHVEVTATVPTPRGVVVLVRAFSRHAPGVLAAGFTEGLAGVY